MTFDPEESSEERLLLEALRQLPRVEPPADQRERFLLRAEGAKTIVVPTRRWVPWAIAAFITISVAGGWLVDHHRQQVEIENARSALTIALKDLSAATRLQAVRAVGGSDVRDKGIVETLSHALLNDPSANVRTAAAEALGKMVDAKAFTSIATRAIASDGSPFVHAALLHAIEHYSVVERQVFLTQLLALHDLDPVLRTRAEAALKS